MEPFNPAPPPLRVLTRPSSATGIPSTSSFVPSCSSEPHPPLSSNPANGTESCCREGGGVVVVGFVGKKEDQISELMNRILDDNVFGSGNLDTSFPIRNNETEGAEKRVKDWRRFRKISYYHQEEKGVVFLQFARTWNAYMMEASQLDSAAEDQHFGDLQGMLFMFSVTPPFPTVLAMRPVVQFEDSCLPQTVIDRERESQFSLGCRVILPPDSFLSLRLPFIYGVLLDDKSWHPLKPRDHQPELSAWITGGTTLQVISKESSLNDYSTCKS